VCDSAKEIGAIAFKLLGYDYCCGRPTKVKALDPIGEAESFYPHSIRVVE
jgi:hypothetical protein